jgi:GH25 family lysozyme M1 (1,4-beta-N-acetylmuramidase)
MTKLIDLSSDNPDVTSWAQAKAAGYSGMIHRATLGLGTLDKMFNGRMSASRAAGFRVGAYHLFYPLDDPKYQAQQFAETARLFSPLLLAVDLEWVTKNGKNEWDEVGDPLSLVRTFFYELKQHFTGDALVYMGKVFADQYFPTWDMSNPLWVPDYTQSPPRLPAKCPTYSIWQTGQETVAGVQGTVDVDWVSSGVDLDDLLCHAY